MLVALLGFTSFCLTLAALPLWAVQGGISVGAAGTVTTVMLMTTVATQLAVPAVVARWGTAPTLVVGLVAMGAPAPLLALSHAPAVLLPVCAVRGAGFAVLTVLGSLLTTKVAPAGRHGESVGLYGLATAVPNLVGAPLGVALTQHGAFWWVAVLSAAPVLAVPFAPALGRAGRSASPTTSETASSPAPSSGSGSPGSGGAALRAVAAPSLVLFAATLTAGGLVTFLPIEVSRGSVATAGLLLFGLSSGLGRWRVGALADRMGVGLLLPWSVVASVVGILAVAGGLERGSGAAVLVGALVFGGGYGAVLNLTLVTAFARAGRAGSTTASSGWNAAFDSGTAVGAGGLGAAAAVGISIPGGLALAALLMVATLAVVCRRDPRRPRRRDR
jgi:predicted MFS family arabinose efflux permease